MRWVIGIGAYAVFLATTQLLIEIAVNQAVSRYQRIFWGGR